MKLQQLSETDSLTGIFNRRKFIEQLDKRFQKYKRYNRPTALVIFDIDYFKQINDDFGHSVGDDVLCRLTRDCASQLREVDSLYRIGGEEFAVILPETDAKDGCRQAERMRQVSEQLRVDPGGAAGKVSISAGVSELIDMDVSIEDVMRQADTALYEAKGEGRNRVVVSC
ncbi:MAG: GGDEF domain-containing protein [Desulfobacteraceae bacterium]|nr:GGDEF domain-containing protein [Desulfobacteraceae bacterium]